jgi:cell division protein FtsQ
VIWKDQWVIWKDQWVIWKDQRVIWKDQWVIWKDQQVIWKDRWVIWKDQFLKKDVSEFLTYISSVSGKPIASIRKADPRFPPPTGAQDMTDISSISRSELAARRRKLRRQRRWRILQTSWQVIAISGLAVGAIWVATLPDWVVRNPEQVEIEGNKILTTDTIRSLLAIKYPQFLLALEPTAIAKRLEDSQAPIAEAQVTRRLFPPGITVHIQERYPVAVVYMIPTAPPANPKQKAAPPAEPIPVSLLDDRGYIISYEKYVSLNKSRDLPTLKVFGMQEQYRTQWESLYKLVSQNPIKISEINWREPGNLIFQTELGTVHLGSYSPDRLAEQLQALDQMRKLPEQVKLEEIQYIDLNQPKTPQLKMFVAPPIENPDEPDEDLPQDP